MAQDVAQVNRAALYRTLTLPRARSRQNERSSIMGQAIAIDGRTAEHWSAIRADLAARIAAIDVRAPYTRAAELAPDIDAIRLIAHRNGMNPAVTVAHFLDSALARGEHGALVHGWLALLSDAVGCERQDVAACDVFAAACSVRLAQ
jgi:hypothetical protein